MRVRDIELLHMLFRTGSVSDAARRLHMTQPNASKILKRLEDQIGFELFDRVNGRLQATQEGRQLLDQAERTLLSLQEFSRVTRDIRDMRGGRFSIGSLPLLSRSWLPHVLSDFLRVHREVSASFHTRSSQRLVEWVAGGQIDLAIAMLMPDDAMVDSSILTTVQIVAALPVDDPLTTKREICAQDLHGKDYISLGGTDHARDGIDGLLAGAGARPNERAECALPAVAIRMVEAGVGVALVDHITASEYEGNRLAFRPFRPLSTMDIWLLQPRMRPRSRLTDLLISALRDAVATDKLSMPPDRIFGPAGG